MPPFASEQLRKIFVGGLNLDTTEESLKEYFSRWGETVDVVVMRFPDTKRSRGFGFVTYEKVDSVDAVLNDKPHVLDGKEVEPKRAIARDETPHAIKDEAEKNLKVFVGGLGSSTTEADIRDCFTKFCEEAGHGKVEEIMIMRDKENNDRLRGFCFVTFDSPEIVDKVVSVKYFEIRTKSVEVRRAESRTAMKKKEDKEYGSSRRRMDDRRRDDNFQGSGRMRGNYGPSYNQMQGNMSGGGGGGGGMPYFGGGFGGNGGGNQGGNYGGGFNMNPMALAGMMNMLAKSMGMNMGNMGGAGMGGMGMNSMGGGAGDAMGAQNRASNDSGYRNDAVDGFRGSGPGNAGLFKTENPGSLPSSDGATGFGSQAYNDQGAAAGYANAMSAMFSAAGVSPANVQAALYNAYGGGAGPGGGSGSQLGSYDQSSSMYGPSRSSPAGGSNRGFKPY